MYNGKKINELLKERRIRPKELLDYLGVKDNGTIARFTGADIKASRLEQIADFFEISIDALFIREHNYSAGNSVVMGNSNSTRDITVGSSTSRAREAEAHVKSLERELRAKDELIREKDRTIRLLEEMIRLLQKNAPSQPVN